MLFLQAEWPIPVRGTVYATDSSESGWAFTRAQWDAAEVLQVCRILGRARFRREFGTQARASALISAASENVCPTGATKLCAVLLPISRRCLRGSSSPSSGPWCDMASGCLTITSSSWRLWGSTRWSGTFRCSRPPSAFGCSSFAIRWHLF